MYLRLRAFVHERRHQIEVAKISRIDLSQNYDGPRKHGEGEPLNNNINRLSADNNGAPRTHCAPELMLPPSSLLGMHEAWAPPFPMQPEHFFRHKILTWRSCVCFYRLLQILLHFLAQIPFHFLAQIRFHFLAQIRFHFLAQIRLHFLVPDRVVLASGRVSFCTPKRESFWCRAPPCNTWFNVRWACQHGTRASSFLPFVGPGSSTLLHRTPDQLLTQILDPCLAQITFTFWLRSRSTFWPRSCSTFWPRSRYTFWFRSGSTFWLRSCSTFWLRSRSTFLLRHPGLHIPRRADVDPARTPLARHQPVDRLAAVRGRPAARQEARGAPVGGDDLVPQEPDAARRHLTEGRTRNWTAQLVPS